MGFNGLTTEYHVEKWMVDCGSYPHGRVDREHDDKPLECWVPQFSGNFLYECWVPKLAFLVASEIILEKKAVGRTVGLTQEKTPSIYIYIRMKYG